MCVTEPFDFDEEYARALIKPLHDRIEVRFVSAGALIRMKSAVGRPQDHLDVENPRIIESDDDRRSTSVRSADRLAPDNRGRRTPVTRPERKVHNDEHEA
jgi:hypothetical protein